MSQFAGTLKRIAQCLLMAGLLAGGIFIIGCTDSDSSRTGEVPETFIFGRGADAQKLDPADIDDGESVNTLAQMLEGLLAFKPGTLEVEPRLAESYEISEDGLEYTFHIRKGIEFHDGTALNAETASYSFKRQMNPEHPAHFQTSSFQYWQNLFGDIDRIEVVDEMTIRFHLSQPNAGILTAFASFPVWLISPAAFEKYGDQIVFNPVGTGPYKFVSWRPNEAIIMEKNENYWGAPAGFERLVLRSIPLNTSRLSELLAGNLHGLDGVQPSELKQLEKDQRFQIYHAKGLNVGYLAFSELREKMADPALRRAIAMSIDREAIVQLVLDGYGSVADFPMPEGFPGTSQLKSPIHLDRTAAERLVAEHPEWKNMVIELATFGQPRAYFPDPQRVASLIKSDLQQIGLKVEIVNREFKSHLHQTRNGAFDIALLGWIADTHDPDNFMTTFFHSKAAVLGSATNISFYKNTEMDQLLEAGLRTTNEDERAEIYGKALSIWANDLPIIPLVQGEQITVLVRQIEGYTLSPTGNHFFAPVRWTAED